MAALGHVPTGILHEVHFEDYRFLDRLVRAAHVSDALPRSPTYAEFLRYWNETAGYCSSVASPQILAVVKPLYESEDMWGGPRNLFSIPTEMMTYQKENFMSYPGVRTAIVLFPTYIESERDLDRYARWRFMYSEAPDMEEIDAHIGVVSDEDEDEVESRALTIEYRNKTNEWRSMFHGPGAPDPDTFD